MTNSALVLICLIGDLACTWMLWATAIGAVVYSLLFEHVRLPGLFAFCAQMQQSMA